tara:strand:+ start:6644 stop:6859 length:216 start_codon:yes stop_codon:yes gene_type:complete
VLWSQVTQEELIVTSLNDHIHAPRSRHYRSLAIDLDTPRDINGLASWLSAALQDPYEVINERNHVHVEWDD